MARIALMEAANPSTAIRIIIFIDHCFEWLKHASDESC